MSPSAAALLAEEPEADQMLATYGNREWRLDHLYYVQDETGTKVLYKRRTAQKAYCENQWVLDVIAKARQLGFCLSPETRVMTADLQWVRLDDLPVGAEIAAVDECAPKVRGSSRKMRIAVVEKKWDVYEDAYLLTMSDGTNLTATGPHKFLSRQRGGVDPKWQRVDKMRVGDVIRRISDVWPESDYEDGWFGGLLDGEGSMRQKPKGGFELTISQVAGPVLNRARAYLQRVGVAFREDIDWRKGGNTSKLGNKPVHKLVVHRSGEAMQLLGRARPSRFDMRWWVGRSLPQTLEKVWGEIVAIEALGKRRMIDIQTSEKTFIAEGYVSHNSTEIAIEITDFCVFNRDKAAGIIDFKLEDAKKKLAKIKFAYDNLPEVIREEVTLLKANEDELKWSNGSSCVVGTSHRGGTLQFLHWSEAGKAAAEKPEVAAEIVAGALNTIAPGQIVKVESTAHGTSGIFHDMVDRAKKKLAEGTPLTVLDFKLHFYGWMFRDDYRVQRGLVTITNEVVQYFKELKGKYGIEVDGDQMAWYQQKLALLGWDKMREEFPSCIAGDVLVATPNGLIPMKDVMPDGEYVLAKFDQGEKGVYRVTTSLGYELKSTMDHPFLCEDGEFRELKDLGIGDAVALQKEGQFGRDLQVVRYHPAPFVDASVTITEQMALFLGIYMGDGSFYDGQVSIACDAQDTDLVEIVTGLLREISGGEPYVRHVGRNQGCADVRISRATLIEPFEAMKVIRQNAGGKGAYKRNVCVPDFIKGSPRHVVAAFLRGLFEADGFASKVGAGIKFFGREAKFVRDIQLLLLQFGITSKLTFNNKVMPNGKVHGGYSLSLRQAESAMFAQQIGFLSQRKKARLALPKKRVTRPALDLSYIDKITSIEFIGVEPVYDITTSTHQFSAGGVVVHNCLDECFFNSLEGAFFKKELSAARMDKRIGLPVPFDPTRRVYTCWDKGMNEKSDRNSIWWFQHDGVRYRWIDYYENGGENIAHYARVIEEKRIERKFIYAKHYGPHDLNQRIWGTTSPSPKTMKDVAKEVGIDFTIIDRVEDKEISIEAARRAINVSFFCSEHCGRGIDGLDNYRKTWNKVTAQWTAVPFHDWASNPADAFQCGAMGMQPDRPEREPRRESWAKRKGSHWSN